MLRPAGGDQARSRQAAGRDGPGRGWDAAGRGGAGREEQLAAFAASAFAFAFAAASSVVHYKPGLLMRSGELALWNV